jgi:transcriptional regulator EpsA
MTTVLPFSAKQYDSIVEFVDACNDAVSRNDFLFSVYPKLVGLLPHSMFACGIGLSDPARPMHHFNLSFPEPYVRDMLSTFNCMGGPLIQEWKKSMQPLYYDNEIMQNERVDERWFKAFTESRLDNIVGHGVLDHTGKMLSFFGFGAVEGWSKYKKFMVRMLIPHLHIALARICQPAAGQEMVRLSAREKEMLDWICYGKSNQEIAGIIGISHWTVKVHVRNLMTKLDVTSRSQAVAKAYRLGIILSQ